MKKSETVVELADALAQAQAEMPIVPMNSENPFLHNKFADLGAVISSSRPILEKHGLSISQFPASQDGKIGVTSVLMHKGGEWMEETILLDAPDEKGKSAAQVAGSIITYLRRYSWAAILGLYADEDSDGNQPERKSAKSNGNGSKPASKQEYTRPLSPDDLQKMMSAKVKYHTDKGTIVSDNQRNVLASILDKMLGSDTRRYELCNYLVGQSSTKKMTQAQVAAMFDWVGVQQFSQLPANEVMQEAEAAHTAALKASGQQELIPQGA